MTNPVSLQAVQTQAVAPREQNLPQVSPGFGSLQSFELMVRQSKLLTATTLVPAAYRQWDDKKGQENPSALANCCVALNMAQRMGADPLMVMQNLYIVEGRPSWSSQWIIAAINGCGRFSPLRFELKDLGEQVVDYIVSSWEDGQNGKRQKVERKNTAKIRNIQCVAWAVETGTAIPQFSLDDLRKYGGVYGCCKTFGIPLVESPSVSVEMAVKEGWYGKIGSKWQTMPEVMLRYRTASFFGKLYAPELLMGLQSVEEIHDILDATPAADGSYSVNLEALRPQQPAQAASQVAEQTKEPAAATVNTETGEVTKPAASSTEPTAEEKAEILAKEAAQAEKPADLLGDQPQQRKTRAPIAAE